jgi:hypothetical protein
MDMILPGMPGVNARRGLSLSYRAAAVQFIGICHRMNGSLRNRRTLGTSLPSCALHFACFSVDAAIPVYDMLFVPNALDQGVQPDLP